MNDLPEKIYTRDNDDGDNTWYEDRCPEWKTEYIRSDIAAISERQQIKDMNSMVAELCTMVGAKEGESRDLWNLHGHIERLLRDRDRLAERAAEIAAQDTFIAANNGHTISTKSIAMRAIKKAKEAGA